MNNDDKAGLFPQFQRSIENLIEDEEGNIPGKKLLALGTLMVVLSSLMTFDAFAAHKSHVSHSSHRSHSSGSHGSHSNHGSHTSHESHQSHTSHSNTASHSNSKYSAEGDVTYSAPAASNVGKVTTQPVVATEETFQLPDINQHVEMPNNTPGSSNMISLAVPSSSPGVQVDSGDIYTPSSTDVIE